MKNKMVRFLFAVLFTSNVPTIGLSQGSGCPNQVPKEGVWGSYYRCFLGTDGVYKAISYKYADTCIASNGRRSYCTVDSTYADSSWKTIPCSSSDGGQNWQPNLSASVTFGGQMDHRVAVNCP